VGYWIWLSVKEILILNTAAILSDYGNGIICDTFEHPCLDIINRLIHLQMATELRKRRLNGILCIGASRQYSAGKAKRNRIHRVDL
jgi:hypothetical protein